MDDINQRRTIAEDSEILTKNILCIFIYLYDILPIFLAESFWEHSLDVAVTAYCYLITVDYSNLIHHQPL
jgi:hypothetical protein